MADPIAEVKVETLVVPEVKVEAPKEDLFKRVAEFKPVEQPKQVVANEFGLTQEDYEKVTTDPTLSKYYKSLVSGSSKKFQEAAELRKQAEAKLSESNKWTPSRIQELLNNPDFVMSAQAVAQNQAPKNSGMSDQEWSALSDTDKAKFQHLEQRQSQMEQLLLNERRAKEDEVLKAKYPDYAPDIVDTTISNLVSGKVSASREDIWKVINFDTVMNKAYLLGKQDASLDLGIKRGASSPEGFNTTTQETITPIKGEKDLDFFRRIVMSKFQQQQKK